jgi:hypothetical protein
MVNLSSTRRPSKLRLIGQILAGLALAAGLLWAIVAHYEAKARLLSKLYGKHITAGEAVLMDSWLTPAPARGR